MDQLRIKDSSYMLVPAIMALEQLGFAVTVQRRDGGRNWWRAETPSLELVASEPLKLLGLAKLHELRGADWTASSDETQSIVTRHKLELRADSPEEPPSREDTNRES